jgi:hypothetical protein
MYAVSMPHCMTGSTVNFPSQLLGLVERESVCLRVHVHTYIYI